MKYSAVLCLLLLFACGNNRNEVMTKLLSDQKSLKDSANNIRDRIGDCLQKDGDDIAEAQKKQLGTVYARLINIQSSIDSLDKMK